MPGGSQYSDRGPGDGRVHPMRSLLTSYVRAVSLAILLLTGCGDEETLPIHGPKEDPGEVPQGTPGQLVTFTPIASGDARCPWGGVVLKSADDDSFVMCNTAPQLVCRDSTGAYVGHYVGPTESFTGLDLEKGTVTASCIDIDEDQNVWLYHFPRGYRQVPNFEGTRYYDNETCDGVEYLAGVPPPGVPFRLDGDENGSDLRVRPPDVLNTAVKYLSTKTSAGCTRNAEAELAGAVLASSVEPKSGLQPPTTSFVGPLHIVLE